MTLRRGGLRPTVKVKGLTESGTSGGDVNVLNVVDTIPKMKVYPEGDFSNGDFTEFRSDDKGNLCVILASPTEDPSQTPVSLLSQPQELTDTFSDLGPVLNLGGGFYSKLGIFVELVTNDSTEIFIKVAGRDFIVGGNEYELEGAIKQVTTTESGTVYRYFCFEIETLLYAQLQVRAERLGATPGRINVKVNIGGRYV